MPKRRQTTLPAGAGSTRLFTSTPPLHVIILIFTTALIASCACDHATQNQPEVISAEDSSRSSINLLTSTVTPKSSSANELRLPPNLIPTNYELTIRTYLPGYQARFPDERNFTFDGTVRVHVHCTEATDKVVLNQKYLTFAQDTVRLIGSDGIIPPLQLVDLTTDDEDSEMVTMLFNDRMRAGENYTLQFNYRGNISQQVLSGLYLSQYVTPEGTTRYLAVTQMAPTDARRMVPCLDEPAMKAKWRIAIEHPKGSLALSNGKETGPAKPIHGGWLRSEFQETEKMSSYLVAVIVCDFDYTEAITKRGTRFRVWARPEAKNQTGYALKAGMTALEFSEDFYDIPYPMPKQDMIALPDFKFSAMENWGLITYREQYLLYDENLYTLPAKRTIASIVAHEITHQWFGNLVTMQWWEDLWLKEGFATYMAYLASDVISNNDFKMDEYFIIDALESALAKDQKATSHPLFVPIERASEIYEVYDSISYDKGASVLRMVDRVITRDSFKSGMNVYLNRFKYGNAFHNDLWNAFTEKVPANVRDWNNERLNVTAFAASWTEQMGYPVVSVKRNPNGEAVLTQERFKLNNKTKEKERYANNPYGYQWEIPIFYTVNGVPQNMTWLLPNAELTLKNVHADDTLIINPGAYGFYLVNYCQHDWSRIGEELKGIKLDTKTRAQLIGDAFALAEGKKLDYSVALTLTRYLETENEYLPWRQALSRLNAIKGYYEGRTEYVEIQEYMKGLIMPLYNAYNWDNLPTTYTDDSKIYTDSLHQLILSTQCKLEDSACDKSVDIFKKQFLDNCRDEGKISSQCSSVPLLARSTVYCQGVKAGGQATWEFVFERYKKETSQLELSRLLAALACAKDTCTLTRLLDIALGSANEIRKQDVAAVFGAVAISNTGSLFLWNYFQENWSKIYETFKGSQTLLTRIISSATANLRSENELHLLEDFIARNADEARTIQQFDIQVELVKDKVEWIGKNYEKVANWFKEQNVRK